MRNNKKQLLVLSVLALLTTTGCLNTENTDQPAQQPQPQFDHRAALVQALNKQAVSVVAGINEVIIKGDFLKNLSLENPPEPIPMNDNNEINKAINYMLSNQSAQNGALIYTPDEKLCSEVIAKNNPQSCVTLHRLNPKHARCPDVIIALVDLTLGLLKPYFFDFKFPIKPSTLARSHLIFSDIFVDTLQSA